MEKLYLVIFGVELERGAQSYLGCQHILGVLILHLYQACKWYQIHDINGTYQLHPSIFRNYIPDPISDMNSILLSVSSKGSTLPTQLTFVVESLVKTTIISDDS